MVLSKMYLYQCSINNSKRDHPSPLIRSISFVKKYYDRKKKKRKEKRLSFGLRVYAIFFVFVFVCTQGFRFSSNKVFFSHSLNSFWHSRNFKEFRRCKRGDAERSVYTLKYNSTTFVHPQIGRAIIQWQYPQQSSSSELLFSASEKANMIITMSHLRKNENRRRVVS